MLKLLAVTLAVVAAAATLVAADCSQYKSCATCIASASPQCGWCSEPLVYDGKPNPDGFKCGGYDSSNPALNNFTCNGVFSTVTCENGYKCDTQNYTCVMTPPGTGQSKDQCESNCTSTGKTFACNNQTYTCDEVPATTPGAASLQVCQQNCKDTHTTAPTHTQQTQTATATGSNHSQSPSSHHPTTTLTPLFKCDAASESCVAAKPGEGESKVVCEAECKKRHNHTPTELLGLWRGFSISNEPFSADEYDFNFMQGGVVEFTHKVGVILKGSVTSIADVITMNFGSETMACLFKAQLTQPTTYEMMFACAEGATAPSSFATAMSGSKTGKARVLLLQRCVDTSICTFKLQAGPNPKGAKRGLFLESLKASASSAFAASSSPVVGASEPCEQYGASCLVCLSNKGCGWCSTNVTYQTGAKGSQCSAFQHSGSATPWQCSGSYTTDQCVPGWQCNATSQQCVPTQPGDGNPSKRACEAGCKAKPGPPSQLIGKYRGLIINKNYMAGVLKIDMTSGNITETLPTGQTLTGTIEHYAAYVFIKLQGVAKIGCIWSQQSNAIVEYVTFACGLPGGALPKGFDGSMNNKDGSESILAKCIGSDCSW